MLVFANFDHIQPAPDKPHIHHAYDGFHHGAGFWVRMNPDQTYVSWVDPGLGDSYRDYLANNEPGNWVNIESWAYPNRPATLYIIPLAAVAEMADRLYENRWENDLTSILFEYSLQAIGP